MHITDLLIERAELIRKNLHLKIAVAVLALVILPFYIYMTTESISGSSADYIGVIKIENVILDDPKFDRMLDDINDSKLIKGLVVYVNSPGGSSGASEKIYQKLKTIGKKIPVVASFGSVAASGGYLVALSSKRIFAMNMTITGSIGVLSQSTEIVDAAQRLGINFKNYKSSPLKASPNPFEKPTPEAEAAILSVIHDSCDYFVSLVSKGRHMKLADAKKVSDGRVFTGRQALALKLVDEIGTLDDAIEWIKKDAKLPADTDIRELEPKKQSKLLDMLTDTLDNKVGDIFNKYTTPLSTKFLTLYQ